MKSTIYILFIIILFSACKTENSELNGKWLNTNFSFPHTITFIDSVFVISPSGIIDTISYDISHNTLLINSPFERDIVKLNYKVDFDTLFTISTNLDSIIRQKYYRAKSGDYFSDIKSFLGIDLNLPLGYSDKIGNYNIYNSIFIPTQEKNDDKISIYLNKQLVVLDSSLHKRLFQLRELDEFSNHKLIALYIDSDVSYKIVKIVKNELRKVGYYKIAFIGKGQNPKHYESCRGIKQKLPPIFDEENYFIDPDIRKFEEAKRPPISQKFKNDMGINEDYPNVCNIEIIKDQIYLNGHLYKTNQFYQLITEKNLLTIILSIDSLSVYQTFYKFIAEYDSLYKIKKNQKSMDIYQKEYNQLIDRDAIKQINNITVRRLIEK